MTDYKAISTKTATVIEATHVVDADPTEASPQDWLDQELMRIAEGDPILDDTELARLQIDGKDHNLKLTLKPLKERIVKLRSAANHADQKEATEAGYAQFMERLNAEFFVFMGGDKVYIGSWSQQGGRRVLVQRSPQDFRLLLANKDYVFSPSAGRYVPAAEAWLRDPNRREVRGFVFESDPAKSAELIENGFENLFEGFAVEPKFGSIDPFLTHLQEIIVVEEAEERREGLINYLLDCFAHLVQRPGVPLKVALVFRGRQGSGKSYVTDTIASLFRSNVFETSHADDIVGRFTDHLLNACLVIGDEALFAGSKKDADAMKRLITQDTLRIEGKHKAILNEKNRMTLMLTSNHEHAVRIEPSDRRFIVFDASDARTPRSKHAEYWDALWSWAKSPDGKAALLNGLLARNLSDFDAQRDRPQTKARLDQILASLDSVHRWFFEVLIVGGAMLFKLEQAEVSKSDLSDETTHRLPEGGRVFLKNAFFEAYSAWEKETVGGTRQLDQRMFWKHLNGILGHEFIGKKRVKGLPTHVVTLPRAEERAKLFLSALGCEDLGVDMLDVQADAPNAKSDALLTINRLMARSK